MKKRTLEEELSRIHHLTYGKNLILREDTSSDINLNAVVQKTDDPTKAKYVSDSVSELYNNLEAAANAGGLKQEAAGSITYKKEVESLQIGLYLLGYELPKYGIDGKFGPETAATVIKFDSDNKIATGAPINETTDELRAELSKDGYSEKSGQMGELADDLTTFVSHILNDFKASYPKVKVTITGGNDAYHKKLGYASKHTKGEAVDLILDPYTSETDKEFRSILDTYKNKDSKFTYIDEYTHPSAAATAGHFHLQYGTPGATGEGSAINPSTVTATPDMIKKMVELLKTKNITPEEMDKVVNTAKVGSLVGVNPDDFSKMINLIINKLEGGYYHPNMLADGRVKDSRYGASGETMFGIDRKNGPESKTQAGLEFWSLIDNADAQHKWPNEFMGGDLAPKLRELVVKMMQPQYMACFKRYLTPEAQKIVATDPKLVFQFIYATFNGEGWFRDFAKYVDQKIQDGVTDTAVINKGLQDLRTSSKSSLMAQVGNKMNNILNTQT